MDISTDLARSRNGTYVEIDNLRQQRRNNKNEQDVKKPLRELRFAIDLGDDSRAQTLGSNNTQSTNHAADTDVDKHALLAIARAHPECSNQRPHDDDTRVSQKARRNDEMLHFLDIADRGLLRCIHGDHDRPDDTRETADLAHEAKSFFQEDRR